MVLFIIAQYPGSWTVQSVFYVTPPGRPAYSNTNPTSLGSIQTRCILREDYSLKIPPLSIARYSFIQPSELERHGEHEHAQSSKQQQRGIRTHVLSLESQEF